VLPLECRSRGGRSDEVQERQGVLPDVQRMRSQGCVVGVYQDISGI
jgi:hypothetical protein